MKIRKRRTIAAAITDFRQVWRQVLLIGFVTRLLATALSVLVLAIGIRIFMIGQERATLNDADIISLFLSPLGIVILVVLAVLWLGVAIIEQATLMTAGYGAIDGRPLTWLASFTYVTSKIGTLLTLGGHLLARVLAVVLPSAVLVFLLIDRIVRDHDIYHLLYYRPSWFLWSLGFLAILTGSFLFLLSFKVVSWLLAIPAVLFENLSAIAAIHDSVNDSRHHRWQLAGLLTLWITLGFLTGILGTLAIGFGGRLAAPVTGESAEGLASTIAATGVIALAFHGLVSLVAVALFALSTVRVYRTCSGPGDLPKTQGEAVLGPDQEATLRVPGKKLLFGITMASLIPVGLAIALTRGLECADSALVIAHRGGMKWAPENTVSAVKMARNTADFVEIDVQLTADGTVVVFHDVAIDVVDNGKDRIANFRRDGIELLKAEQGETKGRIVRSADGEVSVIFKDMSNRVPLEPEGKWVYINDTKFDDLKDIDVGSWLVENEKLEGASAGEFSGEGIPTLAQILEICKGRMKVMIELKYDGDFDQPDLAKRVGEIVEDHRMEEDVMIMSFHPGRLAQMKALRPNWECGQLFKFQPHTEISGIEADFIAVQKRGSRPLFLMATKRAGFEFYTFTVDDPFEISAMISRGADGIITNDPALARRVVDFRKEMSPLQRLLVAIGAEVGTFSIFH